MKLLTQRKLLKPLLLTAVCAIPVVAYAATKVRVTVNGQSTSYRAIIVDGTTYVALRDVAAITGRSVSYNGRSRVVDISGGGNKAGNNSGNNNGNNGGGTTQRAGNEGSVGQWLTTPTASLRVTKSEVMDEYGDKWTLVRGLIRNPSPTERTYSLKDARLALKDGRQISMTLQANEVDGGSYAGLQRAEETSLNITFKGEFTADEIDRVVVTLGVDSSAVVFRAKF